MGIRPYDSDSGKSKHNPFSFDYVNSVISSFTKQKLEEGYTESKIENHVMNSVEEGVARAEEFDEETIEAFKKCINEDGSLNPEQAIEIVEELKRKFRKEERDD